MQWQKIVPSFIVVVAILLAPIALSDGVLRIATRDKIELLFVGDMMFDRTVRSIGERQGYASLFEDIALQLETFDLVVGNLEGPITDFPSVSRGSVIGDPQNTHFTFPPEIASVLAAHNIFALHLGNNHILDFGGRGLESTMTILRAHDIGYFADVVGEDSIPLYKEIGGHKLAFISYNQFLGGGQERVRALIQTAQEQADVVIVFAHWGEEYQSSATPHMVQTAHQFVDAGADLVVGSHPHVIGSSELYKEKHIYYSLGNFVFDQYWSRDVRCGTVLKMTVAKSGSPSYELIPTTFSNGKVAWGECV